MEKLYTWVDKFFVDLALENKNDQICFKNAIEKFLSTGKKEDAFTVFFCYCEIFKIFGKGYENTKILLETLSDHEYHSGELLSKHRDHYSHSVYVFLLGLAVFSNDAYFKNIFINLYHLNDDTFVFAKFLRYWGMCSLFHDIGYPYQLVHEQIKNYNEEIWGRDEDRLYVSFGNLASFLKLTEEEIKNLNQQFHKSFSNINELLAFGLKLHENYSTELVTPLLEKRIINQSNFLDHGYFSSVILLKKLLRHKQSISPFELDVLTAILLHNNFNKYDFKAVSPEEVHRISIQEHPLAYLLILCDELQIWDRLPYGKISKRDPIAWDFEIAIGTNQILVNYFFESYIIKEPNGSVRVNESYRKLQENKVVQSIMSYIDSPVKIITKATQKDKERKGKTYLSDDNFINLCDFAKAIHASYLEKCEEISAEYINRSFGELSLEFKISNIEQAKSYAEKLELINCFYSSKLLDYPIVNRISDDSFSKSGGDNIGFLAREEHTRWVREKLKQGWCYGTDYTTTEERNDKKIHRSIIPYDFLPDKEKAKDELMVQNLIPLLQKFDSNIKIYNYRFGRKPNLEIAGIGHRFGIVNSTKIKDKVKKILKMYSDDFTVVVRTSYAYGADQLIAECATELGITTKAVLPMDYEKYILDVEKDAKKHGINYTHQDELRMRHLLAQAVSVKIKEDPLNIYAGAADYIINRCQKLIAIWDGTKRDLFDSKKKKEINRGGTYHSLCKAKDEKGMKINDSFALTDIHIIHL